MDWEEYVAERPNSQILYNFQWEAYDELITLSQTIFNRIYPFLIYKIDLNPVNGRISKIMERNRVTRDPYDKKILVGETIYYNKEIPSCLLSQKLFLNLETMDTIYPYQNNKSICLLIT